MATCPTCAGEFTPLSNHFPAQRYCCRACKERAAARKRRAAERAARFAEAERKRESAEALRAELAEQKRRARAARRCAYYDRPIAHKPPGTLYCSVPCYRYARYPHLADPRCTRCHAPVVTPKRKRCDTCLLDTKRARKRAERVRRRRLDRAVVHERYTLEEIAQRDRFMCGLCRKRVAMTKAVPHPKAPTIDHVLPLAHGGDDVRANVQLAHFECNWRKSDGGSQQLALIG